MYAYYYLVIFYSCYSLLLACATQTLHLATCLASYTLFVLLLLCFYLILMAFLCRTYKQPEDKFNDMAGDRLGET